VEELLLVNVIGKLGGQPIWRENYLTDNGCEIIDVHNMEIAELLVLERLLDNIAGVVTVGIFGVRPVDVVLSAKETGVEIM